MTQDEAKRMAARRALEFVEDGMLLGLGSGTTSAIFIQELGERVKQGLRVRGIATSIASQQLAESLSIPITNFDESPLLDLAIDGADEIGPGLAVAANGLVRRGKSAFLTVGVRRRFDEGDLAVFAMDVEATVGIA